MKIKRILITILTFILLVFGGNTVKAKDVNAVNIYFFHTVGCMHCAKMDSYLNNLKEEYSNMNIIKYDISEENSVMLLNKAKDVFDMGNTTTPVVFLGGKYYVGFNDNVKSYLQKYVEKYSNNEYVDVMEKIINNEEVLESDLDKSSDNEFNLPLVGKINVEDVSLFLISIVMGIVDGFNPCAMWVLLFLISMLISNKSKKRIWLLGGAFLLTSALFYFLVMIAWLKTVEIISAKFWFQLIIGLFAIGAGVFNLYNYFKSLKNKDVGCEVTNDTKRKKIMERIKKITVENSFLVALVGIILLAITVNFIELACSAGLPVLFSQILAINNIEGFKAVLYILLYVFFFLIDDLIVFSMAVFTFKISGFSNKFSKYSHLVGGILMLIIGILMIFFPNIIMFNF